MPVSQEVLDQLAISQGEYEAIVERLGREPNHLGDRSVWLNVERALRL